MSDHQSKHRSPLVSVVIPAYNAEVFIERTLRSVLSQTYRNIEVIIIDDGSIDRTVEMIEQIAACDRRVHLLRQANSGVASARNLGIRHAQGEFIAPLDADDIWYSSNLEKQVQCLSNSPSSVGLVYSWSVDIAEDDTTTGSLHAASIEGHVYATLLCHNFLGNASATLIRKECFDKIGGYNNQFKQQQAQGCEDWDLYLRIAERYEFRAVPEFLVGYRRIQQSMSRDCSSMAKSQALMLQSARQRQPKLPAIFYRLSCSSFYLYLAHQSGQAKNDRSTLFWLGQALQVDWFTPILRLGFYALAAKSMLRLLTASAGLTALNHAAAKPSIGSLCPDANESPSVSKSPVLHKSSAKSTVPAPAKSADLSHQGLSLSFKVFVGVVFHRVMWLLNELLGFEPCVGEEVSAKPAAANFAESPLKISSP